MPSARNIKQAILLLGIPLFLTRLSSQALDPSQKEAEAVYANLLKNSALKIASKALNDVLEQKITEGDDSIAKRIKKEQEAWLDELYTAVYSAEPAMRVPIALRMTQERTLAFLSDNNPSKPEPAREKAAFVSQPPPKEAPSSTDTLAPGRPALHPKISDSELRAFEESLQSTLRSLGAATASKQSAQTPETVHSGRLTASQLLAASLSLQTFFKSNPAKIAKLEPAELAEIITKAHGYVIVEAPERRKAATLEAEARDYLLKKDFKKAAESYSSALKLLEDMEIALGTDFDVFDRTVKGAPPASLYTLVCDAQLQSSDFKGCLATAKKGLSVGQRIYKTTPCPWMGELNLIAAKAYFEMKSYVLAELTIREAIKQLTSVESSNLKQARSLFMTILHAGKK